MSSAAAAAPATAAEGAPKKKGKKLLFILIGVVVLALMGAGAAFFILKKNTAEHLDGEEDVVEHHATEPGVPPTFLPLDSMVVNLADPGGNRFVQLAITLQVQDAKVSDAIKLYMPSIRNGILLLVSQLTAEEILKPEGKEKLAAAIVKEVSKVMGYELEEPQEEGTKKPRRRTPPNPLQGVLFSSFIVQ